MQYCPHNLIEAATYGIARTLEQLIAFNPPQHDLNRALVAAVAFGKDDCVKVLLAVADPKANSSQAFRAAVRNNNLSCVELLMPVSDVRACNSEALRLAAAKGFSQYFDMLIPWASAEECTQALGEAVKHKHSQCVDLLKPYLNQAELLKITNKIDPSSDVYAALHTLMAQQQHILLTQEVAVDRPTFPNKRKM